MDPEKTIGWVNRIGNFCVHLFLGDTRDLIVESATKLKGMDKDMGDIKDDIRSIATTLSTHGADIQGLKVHTKYAYGSAGSPMNPNEAGKKLLDDSGFTTQYPLLKDKIFQAMDTMGLRTLYDYEQGALRALEQLQSDPIVDPLKHYAVNHPTEPLELIFAVASWIVRDDYNQYKNLGQGTQ